MMNKDQVYQVKTMLFRVYAVERFIQQRGWRAKVGDVQATGI
jgi:hypothetical protein